MRDQILTEILSRRNAVKHIAEACGITPAAVSQWSRVPRWHVETVAALVSVKAEDIRPDLYPAGVE